MHSDFGTPTLEAIDFQPTSRLAKRLIEVFHEVFDFRDNLDYSKIPDIGDRRKKYRMNTVYHFVTTTMQKKFIKVVNDETGLDVRRLIVLGGSESGISGMFAVDTSFDSMTDAVAVRTSFTSETNLIPTDTEGVAEMRKMHELLDLHTGKLKSSSYGKNNRRKIAADMYFDANAAFLVHDICPEGLAQELNADELAAIMIHEIGHILTIVEHSGDMYTSFNRCMNFANDIRNGDRNLTKIFELIKKEFSSSSIKRNLSASSGNPFLDTLYEKIMKYLLHIAKAYEDFINERSYLVAIAESQYEIFKALTFLAVANFASFGIFNFMMAWMSELNANDYVDANYNNKKSSDKHVNSSHLYMIERIADEFAARHGMVYALTSGLNKLQEMLTNSFMTEYTYSLVLRRSTMYSAVMKSILWCIEKSSILFYLDPIIYENQYKRALRALENTYGFFKKADGLPGPVIDMWIRNVEMTKKSIEEAKTISDTEFAKAMYNIMKNLSSPVTLWELIKDGKLDRDTEIISDRIDAMKYNPFFYQAHKLNRSR